MDSKICFEMRLFVVEAIRGRCASFMILTATVSEICGGQTNVPILVVAEFLPKSSELVCRWFLIPSLVIYR